MTDRLASGWEKEIAAWKSEVEISVAIEEALQKQIETLDETIDLMSEFSACEALIRLKYSIGDTKVIWQMNTMFSTCNTGGMYTAHNKHDELNDKGI